MINKPSYSLQAYIPYLLAVTLAVIGFVKSNESPIIEVEQLLFQLVYFTLVPLSIWFINLKIKDYKWFFLVLINGTLIIIYSIVTHFFFNELDQVFFLSFLRVLIPTILILVFFNIVFSQKKNEKLIVENLQLKAENYKAELENLKKQLNPHFLFNSLTTLQAVIRNDLSKAEEYVIKLSELYRNILQNNAVSNVKLKDELEFAKAYIYLQKTRFKNGLKFEIEVKNDSLQYLLLYFSLQLLIENCIKHNVVSNEKPLHISIHQKDITSITVTNNIQPKFLKEESTGTGLSNLHRRYELMGITNGLTIEENETEFSATLKFF